MNFLAHIYLSGNNPDIQLGNFIGDFVKGRNPEAQFSKDIAKGIITHRLIDEFTDKHPVVTISKNRLRPKYRHYSGVIVDIFYDHFLARNWSGFHTVLLPDFADQFYSLAEARINLLPEKVKWMLPFMIKGNWLSNYARLEGIQLVLEGMSRRTPYNSKMDQSIEDLVQHYKEFENEFSEFFPQLKAHCDEFLQINV